MEYKTMTVRLPLTLLEKIQDRCHKEDKLFSEVCREVFRKEFSNISEEEDKEENKEEKEEEIPKYTYQGSTYHCNYKDCEGRFRNIINLRRHLQREHSVARKNIQELY